MKKDCSNCDHLGRDCPKKLMLLPLDEIIDWCLFVMRKYKLTHEQIARLSNIPKGTIDRVMAKQTADCRYSTIHAIVCALFEYMGIASICLDEVVAEDVQQADELKRQNADLQHALADAEKERQALQTRIADLVESNTLMRSQIAKKDEQIDLLNNTASSWRSVVIKLAGLLGFAVLVIILAIVADKLNPDIGFIWRAAH